MTITDEQIKTLKAADLQSHERYPDRIGRPSQAYIREIFMEGARFTAALSSTPEASDDYEAGYNEGFHHGRSTPRVEASEDERRAIIRALHAVGGQGHINWDLDVTNCGMCELRADAVLASRPTPPEDVAALVRKLRKMLSATGIGTDEASTLGLAIAALAAVPADGETETVTTVEELEALPVGTVVLVSEDIVWQRQPEGDGDGYAWESPNCDGRFESATFSRMGDLPARVLHRPIPESEESDRG